MTTNPQQTLARESPGSLRLAIRSCWPLFISMALLMVGNGLLATLLTLRASGLGFGQTEIGLMQSAQSRTTCTEHLACLTTRAVFGPIR